MYHSNFLLAHLMLCGLGSCLRKVKKNLLMVYSRRAKERYSE
uniref:Uncharacterized protein n=1 Tax=Arundo donax TaxID=35708 RepID=A0A0A9A1W3_ARUDO